MFRIVQEILTNIARHAHATRVQITLQRQQALLAMEVHDNGRGIRESAAKSGQSLGMLGMQERAAAFNGCVTVRGSKGRGTTVKVWIPLGKSSR